MSAIPPPPQSQSNPSNSRYGSGYIHDGTGARMAGDPGGSGGPPNVPVSGYDYQPEDDDDTFVDHGAPSASGGGGGGGRADEQGSPDRATATATTEAAGASAGVKASSKPFSLVSYYANLSAAVGSAGHRGSANVKGAGGGAGSSTAPVVGVGAASPLAHPSQPGASGAAAAAAGGNGSAGPTPSSHTNGTAHPPARNGRGSGTTLATVGGPSNGTQLAPPAANDTHGANVTWQPSRLVSEFTVGKKKVRDMAISPDGARLFAAFADDPVSEMELDGVTLKYGRSVHGVEQVHCMTVVRLPALSSTTFTSMDGAGGSAGPSARKPKRKRRKNGKRPAAVSPRRDFSSDGDFDEDDDDEGLDEYGYGRAGSRGNLHASSGGKENYYLWCGVNRGNIEIIDLQNYSHVGTILNAHKQTVNKIWFLDNGRVWSAGRDKAVVVWDPVTRRPSKKRSIAAILSDLCYVSQTRQVWAIADDSFIRLYDAGGDNAALPSQPHNKTKNTLQMKYELTVVKYNADMNLVWAGMTKSTALIDPASLKTLQTLRLTLSSVAFHEKTAIITGHGPWLENDSDCIAVLDITSPLQPSILFSGACIGNVIPQMGMRLLRKVPLGIVAYMGGVRLQDCLLGVFAYVETKPLVKPGAAVLNRHPPMSKQRTEFVGRRGVIKNPPPTLHVSTRQQQQQLLLTGSPHTGTNAPHSSVASTSAAVSNVNSAALTPVRYAPSVSSVYPSRQVTSYAAVPSSLGGEASVGNSPGSAVRRAAPTGVTPGGPTASTAALAPVSLGVLPMTVTAAPSPEIQASLTQLDKKLEDVRVALSAAARSEAPQTDFAKICVELSRWMSSSRGSTVRLPESETARISAEYITPEGKAAATVVAMLRLIADGEMGFAGDAATATPATGRRSSGGQQQQQLPQPPPSSSPQPLPPPPPQQTQQPPGWGAEGGSSMMARRQPRFPGPHPTISGSPRNSVMEVSFRSPRPLLSGTPRSTWGQTTLTTVAPFAGAESDMGMVSGGTAEAALLGILQHERKQLDALQRQNHRIQSKSEALANGFSLTARAAASLVEQVAAAGADCARVLSRSGIHGAEVRMLQQQLERLQRSLGVFGAAPCKVAVSTSLSAKAVSRTTDALVECVDSARGVVGGVHTTIMVRLQSHNPFSATGAQVAEEGSGGNDREEERRSVSSSDGFAGELDRTVGGGHSPSSPSGGRAPAVKDERHPSTPHADGNAAAGTPPPPAMPVLEAAVATNAAAAQEASRQASRTVEAAAPKSSASPSTAPAIRAGEASPLAANPDERMAADAAARGDLLSVPAPVKCYTVTVTSPRALLELLKKSVDDVESFVSSTSADWDEKLTMYKLFVLSPYDDDDSGGGAGSGRGPTLAHDFIQCLSVWDLWFAERMRTACREELAMALVEVLLECRHREGSCVRAVDGEFAVDGSGASTTGGELYGPASGTGLPSPRPPALHASSSLANSQRVGSGVAAPFEGATAASTLSSSPPNTMSTSKAEEDERPFYFISGDELSCERKRISDRLVTVSLQLEGVVSHMRVSLSQLLSSIPAGVRKNRLARGFAHMIHRWEETRSTEEAGRAGEGVAAPAGGTVGGGRSGEGERAPVKVFADKLRGTLYWSHLTVNFIAMSLAAIVDLLYRLPESDAGSGSIMSENFLFMSQKVADWEFALREERAAGAAVSAALHIFIRCWQGGSATEVAAPPTGAAFAYSSSYEQGRSVYLLRSYLNIAVSRMQHEQSADKAVELFFPSFALAEEASKLVAMSGGDADRNRVGALAVADAEAEARAGADARAGEEATLSGAETAAAGGSPSVGARAHAMAESGERLGRKAATLLAVLTVVQARMEDLSERQRQPHSHHGLSGDGGEGDAVPVPMLLQRSDATAVEQQEANLCGVEWLAAVEETGGNPVTVPCIRLEEFAGC